MVTIIPIQGGATHSSVEKKGFLRRFWGAPSPFTMPLKQNCNLEELNFEILRV